MYLLNKLDLYEELISIMNKNNLNITTALKYVQENNLTEKFNDILRDKRKKDNNDNWLIDRSALSRNLTNAGFYYDYKYNYWYNINQRLESAKDIIEYIDRTGTERYFGSYDIDEYIDTRTKEVKIELHEELYKEIAARAERVGTDISIYLEAALLDYFITTDYRDKTEVLMNTLFKYEEENILEDEMEEDFSAGTGVIEISPSFVETLVLSREEIEDIRNKAGDKCEG